MVTGGPWRHIALLGGEDLHLHLFGEGVLGTEPQGDPIEKVRHGSGIKTVKAPAPPQTNITYRLAEGSGLVGMVGCVAVALGTVALGTVALGTV